VKRLRVWLLAAAALILAFGVALACAVAFGVAAPPTPLPSVARAIEHLDLSGLPSVSWYRARDRAMLAYRAYPGNSRQVAVLIHGSAGQGVGMHALSRTLQQVGVTAYALDMRGHGASGRRGDIDYIGQLDDDLAAFMAQIGAAHPNAAHTLIGFSAGGAFVLRIAGGRYGNSFDSYIAIAPALIYPKGVARPGNGGWATVSLPRIMGLAVLDHIGIHRFDGLSAVNYAALPDDDFFTRTYSYRLAMNFSPGLDYLSALRLVKKPVTVIDGDRG
jgi:non-heme chloroperoxidase